MLISILISLFFNYNKLNSKNINLHSHSHGHIQGKSHIHKHMHLDSNLTLFYKSEENIYFQNFFKLVYLENTKNNENPIFNKIFRPPIIIL